MASLKIIFAGSGEFGGPTLSALLNAHHEVVQVLTQPDRPAGRGRLLTPTPIASLAASRGLTVLKTGNINKESLPPADLMIVIAFGQKISPQIVDHARLKAINLHASILPKYRGAAPINWAIIKGETVAGNSIIRLAERMDAGAILAQSSLPIGETETAGELHDRLAADGAALVLKTIDGLMTNRVSETPQDETQATMAPKLSRAAATLDFKRPAAEISNQIRGMFPWPGCTIELTDSSSTQRDIVTLVRSQVASAPVETLWPGSTTKTGIVAGDGKVVEILEVQPQGKRPMPLAAYQNGHAWLDRQAVSR